jgi:hypothetical protein
MRDTSLWLIPSMPRARTTSSPLRVDTPDTHASSNDREEGTRGSRRIGKSEPSRTQRTARSIAHHYQVSPIPRLGT